MVTAARKLLGMRAHQAGLAEWNPETFYSTGDVVSFGGHVWRATLPTARGHAPQGAGDGSTPDRQMLLDRLTLGFGAGTVGGGLAAPTYTVNSTDQGDSGTATSGTLRHALQGISTPLWIIFDKAVFPLDSPKRVQFTSNVNSYGNKTIDGRGAGVILSGYPIIYRSDISAPLTGTRGQHTAQIIYAYTSFNDYPNESSVLVMGGNNPQNQGGSDMVYYHHIDVSDIEDQNMSFGQHDIHVSRMTMDWSRFGPSPGPRMASHMLGGTLLKLFQVDATDVTGKTITTLDSLGQPTSHGLRQPFVVDLFRRGDQTAHPFPTGGVGGLTTGVSYTVRNVGQASAPLRTFTADSTTGVFTSTGHGFVNGDVLVLTVTGGSLPAGNPAVKASYLYYARDVTTNTFKLSNKAGAGAISFTNNGSGTMRAQRADLTKMQLSVAGGTGSWTPVAITGQGSGWFYEQTEPVYFSDGKGPQWGSHHPGDIQDGFQTFTADPATDTITTLYPHLRANGDRVRFWSQYAVPAGLTQGTTYWVRDATSTTFKLASSAALSDVVDITGTAATEKPFSIDAAGGLMTMVGHGLAVGDMFTIYGASVGTQLEQGIVYWRLADPSGSPASDSDHLYVSERKGEPTNQVTWGALNVGDAGTAVVKNPMVQQVAGPNRATFAFCDFRHMRLRSPKMICGWFHEYNCRGYKWGDPDTGGGVGGMVSEMSDGAQSLFQSIIYRPYSSTGTETHSWSEFTNPHEDVPALVPSTIGIDIDSAAAGPISPNPDWTGGAAAIVSGCRFEDGARSRDATGGALPIVNAARLDWYDPPNGLDVPYPYELIPVTVDPTVLDMILDRGAGNVQPWELVS